MKPLRWLRAWWGRYFWRPCPICGRSFGGFEVGGTLPTTPWVPSDDGYHYQRGVCVCRRCRAHELVDPLPDRDRWPSARPTPS